MTTRRTDDTRSRYTSCDDRRYFFSGQGDSHSLMLGPGKVLCGGRFEIQGKLAESAQATIYSALHRLSGLDVALKVAHSPHCPTETAREFLLQEFQIYRRLGPHPNIIGIHDIFEIESHSVPLLAMSMEFARRGSLRNWLNEQRGNQRLRIAEGKFLFRQLLGALHHLKSRGVVNRDIKPENIVVTDESTIKLIDFGLAALPRTRHTCLPIVDRTWQTWRGTPQYMAPEAFTARGLHEIDHRADIYSAGCIGFEVFSRECRPPFGGTYEELEYQHVNCPPPSLDDSVPSEIARVVARCLEKR